ncbi:MAG: AbrB/MazE/SpoVT family DNA-binding domain-containing protein [Clostridium sp.]|nr:AbrB/MazE/SpoVT family DNA-binding domain-containing protein [Clostridium sp.]
MMEEGIIRNLDSLGRVVIPKEMRKLLNVRDGDAVRIIKQDNGIVIRRAERTCMLCGSEKDIVDYRDNYVCRRCAGELGQIRNL